MPVPVRVLGSCLLAVTLTLAAPASAHIAVEPMRELLRSASPDIAACAERHRLEGGRYLARVVVDATGKVEHVEVSESPGPLEAAPASCLEAAFTRLVFPANGRGGTITLMWPFVLGG